MDAMGVSDGVRLQRCHFLGEEASRKLIGHLDYTELGVLYIFVAFVY